MSKKTKKEKIIADYRKKMFLSKQGNSQSSTVNLSSSRLEPPATVSNLNLKSNAPIQNQSIYIYPIHLIKKDLTKTLLLSILAISFELALFLILENRLSLPFKI